MEKGTSQFCWSAGRCGAMRRGVHAGMPLGCPLPACSWGNNLIFQKTLIFRKSLQICGQGMQPRPWARHASEAKAKAMGKACIRGQGQGQGQGMHPRPRPRPRHAAKAKAAPYGHAAQGRGMQQPRPRQPPWAGSEGQGMLACMLPRPRHAAKAMACLRGHAGRWARWHAPGRRQQQGPSMPHGRGRGLPRGWDGKAVACPWDPYKAMAALGGATAAKPR